MSYILEALRKAEAERHSGVVPGIHAPAAAAESVHAAPGWRRQWPWLALAGAALLLGTLAVFNRPATVAPAVPAPAVPAPAVPTTAAAPAAFAGPVAPEPPAQTAFVPAAPAPEADKPLPQVAARKSPPPGDTPKPAADPAVLALNELPPYIQRELPAMTVGGYIYSANKAERSVLVNKRLLREGDEIAPGLRIESMSPGGMVLAYKGYRYRRSYR